MYEVSRTTKYVYKDLYPEFAIDVVSFLIQPNAKWSDAMIL